MKYTAMVDGQRVEIEVNGSGTPTIEATVDGHSYVLDARMVEPGIYWFNCNGRSVESSVTPQGDGLVVALAGRRVSVEIVDGRTALRKAAHQGQSGAAELRAPMPGKVVKMLVVEGAEVDVNQGILVMEAMKMQNELKSPKKGIVKKINVSEGALVNAGELLASVE